MSKQIEVNVDLINQKLQFSGTAGDNPAIITDYIPPLGDGQGYTSLELFLISLASCSASTVVSLLRKMRKNISGFRVNAKGIRRDQHPTSFEKIWLEFIITSPDAGDEEIHKAIQMSEEKYCPVWAMVKNNVEVIAEYKIIAS
jgi:putative redox protein